MTTLDGVSEQKESEGKKNTHETEKYFS